MKKLDICPDTGLTYRELVEFEDVMDAMTPEEFDAALDKMDRQDAKRRRKLDRKIDEILRDAFGDEPIPSRTAHVNVVIHPRHYCGKDRDRKRAIKAWVNGEAVTLSNVVPLRREDRKRDR